MMNGVRYASTHVDVKMTETKEQVFIAITDDGTGIDEAIRPYLFHRFVKGKTGDTGLGLAISRAIIEQTGGYITVHNTEEDRKSTRLNSSHVAISYAVFCLKKKSRHSRRR